MITAFPLVRTTASLFRLRSKVAPTQIAIMTMVTMVTMTMAIMVIMMIGNLQIN